MSHFEGIMCPGTITIADCSNATALRIVEANGTAKARIIRPRRWCANRDRYRLRRTGKLVRVAYMDAD